MRSTCSSTRPEGQRDSRAAGCHADVIAALANLGLSSDLQPRSHRSRSPQRLRPRFGRSHRQRRDRRVPRCTARASREDQARDLARRLRRAGGGGGVRPSTFSERSPTTTCSSARPTDRNRIFNLGYFTWVEQQGVSLDDFEARRGRSSSGTAFSTWCRDGTPRSTSSTTGRACCRLGERRMVISCAGCGWHRPARARTPFRCPRTGRAGDDVDHVLVRRLAADAQWPSGDEANPFVRYRSLFPRTTEPRATPTSSTSCIDWTTPSPRSTAAGSSSHRLAPTSRSRRGVKTRRQRRWVAQGPSLDGIGDLARRRADRPLTSLGHRQLRQRRTRRCSDRKGGGAPPHRARTDVGRRGRDRSLARARRHLEVCPRHDGDPPGDPCLHRFREAVASGRAVLVPRARQRAHDRRRQDARLRDRRRRRHDRRRDRPSRGRRLGVEPCPRPRRGGGASARSTPSPTIHVVQAAVHSPLVRAWEHRRPDARRHRRELMWPWEPPGRASTGILDDETYDWAAVLDTLERTGGRAVTVTEEELGERPIERERRPRSP